MMIYELARQREKDNRWEMTRRNDEVVCATGYCRAWWTWKPLDLTEIRMMDLRLESTREMYATDKLLWSQLEKTKDKFHDDGHATEVEAWNCFRVYLLDHMLEFVIVHGYNSSDPCKICGVPTRVAAHINNYQRYFLCAEHANREVVEMLWPAHQTD